MTCLTAQERLEEGERLFLLGNLASAQEIFESIINEDESSKEAYNNLGVIAYRHRELEKAFRYFIKALRIDPRYEDAVENLCRLKGEIEEDQRTATPFKLHYSPGIALHGEKMRKMLKLDHYVPSIHINDPVWFFGLYFDQDYLQLLAHGGKKILNWRGSDALRLKSNSWRVQIVKNLKETLHVCQSHRQQEVLAGLGLSSIVRPMINEIINEINMTPFPGDRTRILVFWKRGIDDFIRADLFFEVALRSPGVEFHIVGDESPLRFAGAGKENLIYHGFLSEKDLDRLMDQCKGTLRPWISDGIPNIQTKMLMKGRYAAHSCQFEKVALCSDVDEYVAWIEWLKGVKVHNLEAREWWMNHLNNFDFLDPGFDPAKQGEGEKG